MDAPTAEEVFELPHKFKTVPYAAFFKLWYAMQKALPENQKGAILTKIGRTIGREFDVEGLKTIDEFLSKLQHFLEEDWAITDNADIKIVKNEEGEITKLIAKQDCCKMCFPNTYYRFQDNGSPSCMFPQVMMGVLSKVKKRFDFKNLRYEGVQKTSVGVCAMTWNIK
ncbi:MAG: hypothetical protein ACTSUE_14595 [Promethearchaeota archaeon]